MTFGGCQTGLYSSIHHATLSVNGVFCVCLSGRLRSFCPSCVAWVCCGFSWLARSSSILMGRTVLSASPRVYVADCVWRVPSPALFLASQYSRYSFFSCALYKYAPLRQRYSANNIKVNRIFSLTDFMSFITSSFVKRINVNHRLSVHSP